MDTRSLKFIAAACAGELLRGSPETLVRRVCTDSRQLRAGDLFFALSGERFDGHEFAAEAARKGAAAIVGERERLPAVPGDCALIVVADVRKALGQLAVTYRQDFGLPMVAVAGSNGKTTTKELVASVLGQKLATLWSEASFNNDIGVPLTLLRLEKSHQAAVLEAGTNHPGDLAPLVKMIRPNYGIITCIGREHLEYFGDISRVAQEEGSLAELLPAGGKLFLSGDDEWTNRIAARTQASVVRVGFSGNNDWRAVDLRSGPGGTQFQVEGPKTEFAGKYRTRLLGRHQVANALFALALGVELGLDREEIARGLAECRAPRMRLELWSWGGVHVLDDAYNANADSVLAALRTLQEMPCSGRRVAVLGDMAELGAHTEAAHEEIGRRAAELGVGQLFAVGKLAPVVARGARGAGMNRVFEFTDVATAAGAVKSFVKQGDVVLLKASRATHLERIAEVLRGGDAARKK
jgi:UDP-N-acetylmuramoyl-tripeptide--D-alanyl-D-alanine ligase